MASLVVGAVGFAVGVLVWLPWAQRRRRVALRTCLTLALWSATGAALWAVHEAERAAASGRAAGDAFAHISVH